MHLQIRRHRSMALQSTPRIRLLEFEGSLK
jgi:hypothetical protein